MEIVMKQVLEIVKIDGVEYKIGINPYYYSNYPAQDKYMYELPNGETYTHPTMEGCMKMIRDHHNKEI